MATGRRDQHREMVDQLQWGQRQRGGAVGAVALGARQPVDDLLLIDALETREREPRAGTVTERNSRSGVKLSQSFAVRTPACFMTRSSRVC